MNDFTARLFLGAGLALVSYGLLRGRSPFLAAVVSGAVACAVFAGADAPFEEDGPFEDPDPWAGEWDPAEEFGGGDF